MAAAAIVVVGAAAAPVATAGAQITVAAAVDGRSAPGGVAVISLMPGAKVAVVSQRGANAFVTVEGWVDASRLAGKIDTFPASVDAKAALRIRSTPSLKGAILAELHSRVGVSTLGKSGGWTHVKRSAWIPASALPKAAPAKVATAPARAAPTPKPATPPATHADPPADAPAQGAAPAPAMPGAMSATAVTKLLAAPGGAAVGELAAGSIVQPLEHDHGWSKVRIEGWVQDKDLSPADSSQGSQLTAADLRADPDGTRGKMVQWEVQVLSLQTADPLRPELARDEPYLLAKGPGTEDALLYLAVPPSLLAQAKALPALTRVLITARVRSGRSEPVGIPILDLRSISKR
ncbi:MAG: hypothetical protein ACREN6_04060 [Gemmatimonadaceae bacterium]